MDKTMAEYIIKDHMTFLKDNWDEYNEGFAVGVVMAYYHIGLFSQDEVNQILSDNGLDTISFDEEEDD